MIRWLFIACCLLNFTSTARGDNGHPCAVGEPVSGVVEANARGNGFKLSGSKQSYVLSGLAPSIPPKVGATLKLFPVSDTPDRYGRLPVHAFENRVWIQETALSAGKTIAFALKEPANCLALMRQVEGTAQTAKRGIWAKADRELQASNLKKMLTLSGQFVVVKGKVLSVGDRRRRLYLNFGQKWSQDFTVSVVKQGAGAFKEKTKGALGRLSALKGKTVRVRGIMEKRQGPLIRLVNEAQIEILD